MKTRHEVKTGSGNGLATIAGKPARRTAKSRPSPMEEPFVPDNGGLEKKPVHVEVAHPSAQNVCIAGSFNDWTATKMIPLGSDK